MTLDGGSKTRKEFPSLRFKQLSGNPVTLPSSSTLRIRLGMSMHLIPRPIGATDQGSRWKPKPTWPGRG